MLQDGVGLEWRVAVPLAHLSFSAIFLLDNMGSCDELSTSTLEYWLVRGNARHPVSAIRTRLGNTSQVYPLA
jgi:hypothetical protein